MKLRNAKLCAELECGEIYEGKYCPSCTSAAGIPIQTLLDRKWHLAESEPPKKPMSLSGIEREYLRRGGIRWP